MDHELRPAAMGSHMLDASSRLGRPSRRHQLTIGYTGSNIKQRTTAHRRNSPLLLTEMVGFPVVSIFAVLSASSLGKAITVCGSSSDIVLGTVAVHMPPPNLVSYVFSVELTAI